MRRGEERTEIHKTEWCSIHDISTTSLLKHQANEYYSWQRKLFCPELLNNTYMGAKTTSLNDVLYNM